MPVAIPTPAFSPWTCWKGRDKPRSNFDVPFAFRTPGLYLFAEGAEAPENSAAKRHLSPNVIYIGEACAGVEHRMEWHEVVRDYQQTSGDFSSQRLWFSAWHVGGGMKSGANKIKIDAMIRACERILIWDYVEEFDRYPARNFR